jgi:hypothetical protein
MALKTDMPRSASIVFVDPNTDFAVLNKATYRRVMGKATQKKVEVMISFLRNSGYSKSCLSSPSSS